MSSSTGGTATAAGVSFQCLVTVEALMDALEDDTEFVLTVEDPVDDVVDFSIAAPDGRLRLVAQAKAAVSGAAGDELSPGEIIHIASRLIRIDAEHRLITTNRRLSTGAAKLVGWLGSPEGSTMSAAECRSKLRELLRASTAATVDGMTDEHLRRLCTLSVESGVDRSALDLRLRNRIVDYRRRTVGGIGAESSRILLGSIIAIVLERSGSGGHRGLDRAAAERLLQEDGHVLAAALGRYEWGRPIGLIPDIDSVERDEEMARLAVLLPSAARPRSVQRTVITGLSGIGKSTIASQLARARSELYDVILWFDAGSPSSIDALASSLGDDNDAGRRDGTPTSTWFRDLVARSSARWLIVFDNASGAATVDEWIPRSGRVDVMATSTDATAWVSWPALEVGPLTEEAAADMIRLRLGRPDLEPEERATAAKLAEHLGRWPLAIELACAFLASSGRGLDLTSDYLDLLSDRVIDDQLLIPAAYRSHSTLLQAVLIAFDQVSATDTHGAGAGASDLLDALEFLPPRSAPLDVVARIMDARSGSAYTALEVDEACRRVTTASLIRRVRAQRGAETDDALAINEVVLDIARQLRDDVVTQEVLLASQEVIADMVKDALETQRFSRIKTLTPSAESVLDGAGRLGYWSGHGVTLMGNLATASLARHEFRNAHRWFLSEWMVLDALEHDGPLLRAKISCGIARCALELNAPIDKLVGMLDVALTQCEAVRETGDAYAIGELARTELQIDEILRTLERSASAADSDTLNDLRNRFARTAAPATDEFDRRRIGDALDHADGDAEAIALCTAQLAETPPPVERAHLLGQRAEALCSLGHHQEGLTDLDESLSVLRTAGLPTETGTTSIINVWRRYALVLLGSPAPREIGAEATCMGQQLELRFAELKPEAQSDRDSLAVLRASTAALTAPLPIVQWLVTDLAERAFERSHGVRDNAGDLNLVLGCRKIADLRARLGEAPLLPMHGFQRSGSTVFVEVSSGYFSKLFLNPLGSVRARWALERNGVALVLDGGAAAVIWSGRAGWDWVFPQDPTAAAMTERLRVVISEFAPTVVLVDEIGRQLPLLPRDS
ncbi:hypothetical protein [Plantibacter sp. MPB07]|uniref:hypothetical protein n=1 Tax=Plantibacter sp. MPB07 TaxID=3388853 RepID=UPI003988302A